jgi:hypothetical protein
MLSRLPTCAGLTSGDIAVHKSIHTWPPIMAVHLLHGLMLTGVTSRGSVVTATKNLAA